ncbi:MAG: DUF721 domain-containing protein [Bacteroidota bacterium]
MAKRKATNPRKSDTSQIGDAIGDLLKSYNLKSKFDETQLVSSWQDLMGKPIALKTKKIFIKDKVLFVEITSAPLKHELNMSKSKIKEILQREFGQDIIAEVIIM